MNMSLIKHAEDIFSHISILSETSLQNQADYCSDFFELAHITVRFEYDRQLLKNYFFWQMKTFRVKNSAAAFANIRIWSGSVFAALYPYMEKEQTLGFTLFKDIDPIDIYMKCTDRVGSVLFAWRQSTNEGWVEIMPDSLERFMNLSHMLTPLLSKMCINLGARMLHSAAIVHHKEAVLVSGHSGSGKSTLTASCLEIGMDYISDDAIIYRMNDHFVFPICITLHLSPDSIGHLPHLMKGVEQGTISTAPGRAQKRHLELSGYSEHISLGAPAKMLIFPTISKESERIIRPVNRNRALATLLLSSASLLGERFNPEYMKGVMQSLRSIPMYEYIVTDDFIGNAEFLKHFLDEISVK